MIYHIAMLRKLADHAPFVSKEEVLVKKKVNDWSINLSYRPLSRWHRSKVTPYVITEHSRNCESNIKSDVNLFPHPRLRRAAPTTFPLTIGSVGTYDRVIQIADHKGNR